MNESLFPDMAALKIFWSDDISENNLMQASLEINWWGK